jgi:hypothetical protein
MNNCIIEQNKKNYRAFHQSKNRCNNPNNPRYKDYGGRGIKMCDKWNGKNGYQNFLKDMGERPTGMTLDRIDNNKGYSKENCRWATYEEQNLNKRAYKNSKSKITGVNKHPGGLWQACMRIKGIQKSTYHHTKREAIKARLEAELNREALQKA